MSRPGRIPNTTMINMAPIRATDAERRRWKSTTHQKHTYHRTLADARLAVERRLGLPDYKGAE